MNWINYIKGDKYIWAIAILLSLVSIVLVYSASSHLAFAYKQGNTLSYLFKHIMHLGIGFSIMWLISKVPYKYFYNTSILIFAIAKKAAPLIFTLALKIIGCVIPFMVKSATTA